MESEYPIDQALNPGSVHRRAEDQRSKHDLSCQIVRDSVGAHIVADFASAHRVADDLLGGALPLRSEHGRRFDGDSTCLGSIRPKASLDHFR